MGSVTMMRTNEAATDDSAWSLRFAGVFLLLMASGCDRDPTTSRVGPQLPNLSTSAEVLAPGPENDRITVRLARRIPTYGGAFRGPDGSLEVYVTAATPAALVQDAVDVEMGRSGRAPLKVRLRTGQYTFAELQRWRFAVLPLLLNPGVAWSGVDERENRLAIAVRDDAAEADVRNALATLGVPDKAVAFQRSEKPGVTADLTDRIRPFRGGTQFQAFFNQEPSGQTRLTCTYGLTVTWSGHAGRYGVVNSHCTQMSPPFGQKIGAHIYQSIAPEYQSDSAWYWLGEEMADPPGFSTSPCPAPQVQPVICRHSDAALVQITGGLSDLGYVARTIGPAATLPAVQGSLTVDPAEPRFRVEGVLLDLFPNDSLFKIGSASGWTAGRLISTCVDAEYADSTTTTRYIKLCQGTDSLGLRLGDSGAPVMYRSGAGKYFVAGILHGGLRAPGEPFTGVYKLGLFSHWQDVSRELGGSPTALNPAVPPDVSVFITGPTYITSPGTYTWTANASGGSGNYTYTWERSHLSGPWTVVGSARTYTQAVSFTGGSYYWTLRVTASSGEQSATSSNYRVDFVYCKTCPK